jgi:hypothetical protein
MGGSKEGCTTLKNERKLEEIMKIYRTEMDKSSIVLHAGSLIRYGYLHFNKQGSFRSGFRVISP